MTSPALRQIEDELRSFLIESEQRVIVHCQELLRRDLPTEDRDRLSRLLHEARARLNAHGL